MIFWLSRWHLAIATTSLEVMRSVLLWYVSLFWLVESLPCRSIYKRDEEIYKTFHSSISIERPSKIKFLSSSELQTERPWREVGIVYEGSLRTNLSLGWENAIFQIYITLSCSTMFLINFSCNFGQRKQFFPPSAFTFPTSSFHVPLETRSILFLTKYDKITLWIE